MREIKFRAWIRGKMEYDFLPTGLGMLLLDKESIIPVMQYTGLKDKNGKDIFEGDVVRYKFGRKHADHIVEYQFGGFSPFVTGECNPSEFEIIGNIYENPELLEVKEK